ncbi:hypothetical protein B566_EDAN002657 [Ephemera danica]|nr:hypothetical protein B566_EDAN002657 [Ephemera danica]
MPAITCDKKVRIKADKFNPQSLNSISASQIKSAKSQSFTL